MSYKGVHNETLFSPGSDAKNWRKPSEEYLALPIPWREGEAGEKDKVDVDALRAKLAADPVTAEAGTTYTTDTVMLLRFLHARRSVDGAFEQFKKMIVYR
jgi:hypothetical protein